MFNFKRKPETQEPPKPTTAPESNIQSLKARLKNGMKNQSVDPISTPAQPNGPQHVVYLPL